MVIMGILLVFQVTVDLSHFPEFKDDAAFACGMLMEQSVFTLPGMVGEINFTEADQCFVFEFLSTLQAFSATGCFRIVLVMPDDKIAEACTRIKDFCMQHYTP